MKKALAIRWGAWGDLLIALPFFEALKKEYGWLQLETGPRGEELFRHNPTFDRITVLDTNGQPPEKQMELADLRWQTLMDAYPWDYTVNLWRTLEAECIAEEWQPEYFWPRERRRAVLGARAFADQPFLRGGKPIPDPFHLGTHYFPPEIGYWMPHWKRENQNNFVVVMIVAGSTCQKVPIGFKELAREIIDRYPNTRIYLMGAGSGWMNIKAADLQFDFGEGNVARLVDGTDYHRAAAIVKMADYIIGPISSLMHAAGLFGTPKSTICTDTSVWQAHKYHSNDFSIESSAPCCPCHRAIYHDKFCVTTETPLGILPACNVLYDKGKIIEGVDFAYAFKPERAKIEVIDGRNYYDALPQYRNEVIRGRQFGDLAEKLKDKKKLNIVEIGMNRSEGPNMRDGYSTPYFAKLAVATDSNLYSVDIDPKAKEITARALKRHGLDKPNVHLITEDAISYLHKWNGVPIDILYLDGWDYEAGNEDESAKKHLEAFKTVEKKIGKKGFVLIDDMKEGKGKGELLVPYLVENGYKVIDRGYQYLLQK